MYSCGPLHRDKQRQDVLPLLVLKHTYSSSVQILDVGPEDLPKPWTIGRGGERGSEIYVLIARHDDDDDDLGKNSLYIYIYIYIYIKGVSEIFIAFLIS